MSVRERASQPVGSGHPEGLISVSPAVSVVIPCYGQARFLGEAIDSVLAQSLQDFEIVVVDDGSPDDTAEVASRFERVRLVRQSNQGLAAARNAGLHESRGLYVLFLDADDRLPPRALEAGLACARGHPECGFVWGQYRMIAADGSGLRSAPPACPPEDDAFLALLRRNCIGMHGTVLFRRDVLERAGGFDRSLRACSDYDSYLRIARQFPVWCHKELVAEYRWHGANMSRDRRLMLAAALRVLRRQRRYVRGRPAYERAYRQGRQYWQALYGTPLLDQAARGLRIRGERTRALAELLVVLRYDPAGLLRRLARKFDPRPATGSG